MFNFLLIALLIEALVSVFKPIWSKSEDGAKLSVAEWVSMGLGVLLAVSCRWNIFAGLFEDGLLAGVPGWVLYIFYGLSGIALGRGPSFLHDLWKRIEALPEWNITESVEKTAELPVVIDVNENGEPDLNVDNWSLKQIKAFCAWNDIDTQGAQTREEYIEAIVRGRQAEPQADGVTQAKAENPKPVDPDPYDVDEIGNPRYFID